MEQSQDQLDIVKQAFQEWRDSRPKVGKIPLYLWDMVKPLMTEYPTSMISRALGLSSTQLKQNIIEQRINFVEAISTVDDSLPSNQVKTAPSNHTCDIELKRPCGSVLKINALPVSVVTSLIPSFVGN